MAKEKNIQVLAENFIEKRDDRSFKFLYERVKPGVMNHCYTILKDVELAEDAFLNAMAKVWQKIDQYDITRGNFSTWCYNIARNESLLLLKSRKRFISRTAEEMELESAKEENQSTVYDIEDDPLWNKDIADKYGIKKRSIATRIRRARTKIRKKMEDLTKKTNKK